jgi:DNA-binding IclR family transcriptional regulator
MKNGKREQEILNYINASDKLWCSPTEIGRNVWGEKRHSSTASPVCRRMVNKGLLIRSRDGHYRVRGENEQPQRLR